MRLSVRGGKCVQGSVPIGLLLRLVVFVSGVAAMGFVLLASGTDRAGAEELRAACGKSLQSQINSTPSGGTLVVGNCTYREQITLSKPITLKGQANSQIRGSDVWTEWTKSGSTWRSKKTLPFLSAGSDVHCNTGTTRCKWPQQVFVSGRALTQVASNPSAGQFSVSSDRRVILGETPSSKTVEVSVRRAWVIGRAPNVKIENMTMKHAATEGRTAALMNRMSRQGKAYGGWVVRDSTLSDAHGAVISLKGPVSELQILDNDISRGGQIGILGAANGEIIRGNRIHDNNTENFSYQGLKGQSGGGEAGGVKVTEARNTVLSGNTIYNNNGHGVHYDRYSSNNQIYGNRIYDNARRGIQYEVSTGGKIFNNVLYNNGWSTPDWVRGAGIAIENSSSTEVYGNTLAWNADGIAVISLNREGTAYDHVRNVYVHDNTVLSQDDPGDQYFSITSGWIQTWTGTMVNPTYNNRGANNRYWNPQEEQDQTRYRWGGNAYARLSEFEQTRGETTGSYMTESAKNSVVNSKGIPAGPNFKSAGSL